jgi:PQQ-like domain
VIELVADAPAAPRPPTRRHRRLAPAVTALLVLTLTGATPTSTVVWRRAAAVALPASDAFALAGDRLFVSGASGTTAYRLDPRRRLWQVPAPAGAPDTPVQLQSAGDALLVQRGAAAAVLDPATGATRWTSPTPLTPLPGGRTVLAQDPQFRPGTEYDESSGAPGPLYFTATGVPHTEPPLRTVLTGYDAGTGRRLWSAAVPGSVDVAPDTGRPAFLVVAAAGLSLRDAGTGAVLRERPLHAPGVAYSEVAGDLVLLRYAEPDGGTVVHAYALDTLAPRWQSREQAQPGPAPSCAGLPCVQAGGAITVLDPASGVPRWRADRLVDRLVAFGRYTLELVGDGTWASPVRAVDRVTGAPLVDLSDWATYARGQGQGALVLSRADAAAGTDFGLLQPGWRAVRPLGRAPEALADCSADQRFVACRGGDGVAVWAYRS